ncbi:MAG: zinc-ribbon domain-containing protein [Archangiaceae bacterium]|nr:zinc-ribbon domain-containing protein [Archangiaceae bacterium]
MLISCEKCSTTYVLDDKLIPAQGAPVQCTRCGHVFMARVNAGEAAAPATNRTQMLGVPGAVGGTPAGGTAAPTNKTVMFGVPGAEPVAPPAGSAPAASRTQMFGAGGPDAPASAPANRTVMFGAAGSEAPPAGGAASGSHAPAVPSKTVMFGAPGAPGASEAPTGPGAPANRTMMFGVPGADAPAAPAAGAAPVNRTMMFGAGGAEAPPAAPPAGGQAASPANRTMMFGAAHADPPAASPQPGGLGGLANKTMVFGAPGTEGVPAAPAQPANVRSTMMFGAVPAPGSEGPSQPPPPRTSNTMMFGAPGAQTPPPQAPQPQKSSSTMMFGSPAASAPAAAPPPEQKSSSTMIFGATPVVPPGPGKSPKLTESTVRIGPEDLERMMREHEAMQRAAKNLTPTDSPAASPVEQRHNKTQMFTMTDAPEGATPPAGNDAVARQNKTQMFALSDVQPPAAAPASELSGRRQRAAQPEVKPAPSDSSILDTFPPDQPRAALPPQGAAPAERATDVVAGNPPEAAAGQGVELPPETPDLMQQQPGAKSRPVSSVDVDPAIALRAQVARRNRIALVFIALILVAAALAVTWKVFGKMLLNRAPPAAAVEGMEKALSALRFDDSKSKNDAVAQLSTLVQSYPDFIEGHAALVTAVSLQLDDVQQRVRRIEQLVERKNSQIARYNREKSPANWETLAQTQGAQVEELIKEHKPLSEEGHNLDTKAREAYKGLEIAVNRIGDPSKQARLAALRAQALFHGVSGTDQALVLSKRYETQAAGATPDGWIELAIPEYSANARVSEELMGQALQKLDELHKRDSTFLRTYVLSARLHLIRKELDAATADLDQVLSMRKDHDVAAELREWVRKLPKTEDKKEAP